MDCRNLEPHVPAFENPYPDSSSLRISDFTYATPLHICRCIKAVQRRAGDDADYVVSRPYGVRFKLDGADRLLTVPQGMVTDLSSAPWIVRWIVGRVGPHLEASIVHDFLYIAWQDVADRGARREDREFADKVMLAAMAEARVNPIIRWLIYLAVRLFGAGPYERRDPTRYVRDATGEGA